jgi:hypothetical protein
VCALGRCCHRLRWARMWQKEEQQEWRSAPEALVGQAFVGFCINFAKCGQRRSAWWRTWKDGIGGRRGRYGTTDVPPVSVLLPGKGLASIWTGDEPALSSIAGTVLEHAAVAVSSWKMPTRSLAWKGRQVGDGGVEEE